MSKGQRKKSWRRAIPKLGSFSPFITLGAIEFGPGPEKKEKPCTHKGIL